MKNIAIVYWSGTGNTQKMALAIAEGALIGDTHVDLLEVAKATKEDVMKADVVALGCPSMGCEVLEESEMEPFVQALEGENIEGKVFALFGSYDWGDGQWMRDWEERMQEKGVKLVTEGLVVQNTPDEDGIEQCRQLGKKIANDDTLFA